MYYYQKKLEESIAPFQPKTVAPKAKVASKKAEPAPTHLTIDEMLRVLSDKTPHMVIPVSEFFGWFKKQATTNEQILLTSFSSIVLPRLAAQLNRNANNPSAAAPTAARPMHLRLPNSPPTRPMAAYSAPTG